MPEQTCCGGSSSRRRRRGSPCCGGTPSAAPTERETCCAQPAPEDRQQTVETCGCAPNPPEPRPWMAGHADTPAGPVPRASTKLAFADLAGSWLARWSIGRMDYTVEPGLYCVGNPDAGSPVLVTANYKMTFDRLRKELPGVDAWILVLDTKGINVWCAAGKGTFGAEELSRRIEAVNLKAVVSHRAVTLPQLGAVGVAAHEVLKRSGFRVVWGPVHAEDLKAFLAAGMKADARMRAVRFTLWDRLVLTPMEVVGVLKPSLILFGILFILNAAGIGHYGGRDLLAWAGAVLAGCVAVPALLPWIPGRAFSFKGFLLGLIWCAGFLAWTGLVPPMPAGGWISAAAYLLVLPSLSAFFAMNFTGSSTFTSMSGVDKEMKAALPLMVAATAIGVILLLVKDFLLLFR